MNSKVKQLKEEIASIYKKIETIQKSCKHYNVFYSHGANTGDIFSEDIYWLDITCKDCDARLRYYSDDHPQDYRFMGEMGSVSKEKVS